MKGAIQMNPLKQKMVLKKLNQIQPEDLMKYAKEIDETLTPDQAQKAASLVNGKNINIFNPNERLELLKKISQITILHLFILITAKIMNQQNIFPFINHILNKIFTAR
mgnify:CR=1 FL=1